MKTYKIQLINGNSITAHGVKEIWSDEHGVHFLDAEKEDQAYVPHRNLVSYEIVKPKTLTVNFNISESEKVNGVLAAWAKAISE